MGLRPAHEANSLPRVDDVKMLGWLWGASSNVLGPPSPRCSPFFVRITTIIVSEGWIFVFKVGAYQFVGIFIATSM